MIDPPTTEPNTWFTLIEKGIAFLGRPFTKADSLAAYSTAGYFLLGLAVLVLSTVLWLTDVVNTVQNASPLAKALLDFIREKLHLAPNLTLLIPMIVWFSCWGVRFKAGELTANGLFKVLELLVELGEWCLEHRWVSLALIVFLAAMLAAGVSYLFTAGANRHDLIRAYEAWCTSASRLIEESSMMHPETLRLRDEETLWRKDFDQLLPRNHPATCLHELDNVLFSGGADEVWTNTMRQKMKLVEKLDARCRPLSGSSDPYHSAAIQALIDISEGKVLVRLAKFYENTDFLTEAFRVFTALNQRDSTDSAMLSSINNGLGTVYANAFSAYLTWNPNDSTGAKDTLRSICSDAYQCVTNANESYTAAGRASDPCSFASQRLINNEMDLHNRLAFKYETVINNGPPRREAWPRTRAVLVEHIRQDIRELASCNGMEPVLTDKFVTIAQAHAAIAKLRSDEQLPYEEDAGEAGHFLRIAFNFNPGNYVAWSLEMFCAPLSTELPKQHFLQELRSNEPPPMQPMLEEIERICRSPH